MERKVRFFETLIDSYNKQFASPEDTIAVPTSADEIEVQKIQMDDLEERLQNLEKELQDNIHFYESHNRDLNSLTELKQVLEKDDQFFTEALVQQRDEREDASLLNYEDGPENVGFRLGFVTGVIEREVFNVFERVLFRTTRGNLYMKYAEIDEEIKDPKTGKFLKKNVFITFFQGEELEKKVKRICESFGANMYPCSENREERKTVLRNINENLKDLEIVINRTLEERKILLSSVAKELDLWKTKVIKEKAIYHTMNMFRFDLGAKCLVAEGWVPTESMDEFQLALRRGCERSRALVRPYAQPKPTKETPPTYFPVNKFTRAFQDLIDAYGSPRYREINPTAFTIVTFPFMFGVMFGDVGHGIILLLASLFFIWKEKEWKNKKLHDLIQPAFSGRYIILLMSLFAIYCGFIYNEVFSIPMDLAGTNWARDNNSVFYRIKNFNRAYEFGVDPVWKGAQNELIYYNSMKMKMSIIMGVTHMLLGMVLKFMNSVYQRKELDIFFECIPGTVLMISLFGYMCFLMVYKWCIPYYYNTVNGYSPTREEAPQILSQMIYMFLYPFTDPPGHTLYPKQGLVQGFLVLFAVICVPLMLLPKPLIRRYRHKHGLLDSEDEGDEEYEFSEEMVHQTIETIEFALGSISSTASYLRLWALSLAHSELSTVFWKLGMVQLGLGVGPFVVAFVVFAVWVGVTVGIVVVMESLSAFLHSLRLHWVEFQGKFYKADGILFRPFSFEKILSGEAELE